MIRAQAAKVGAPLHGPAEPEALVGWASPDWPPFLADNFRTALQVCRVLDVRPDRAAFVMPQLRARCERIREKPLVLLDGAHNADSAEKLVASVRQLYPGQDFTVVLGIVKGKDVAGIFNALCRLTRRFVLTNPQTPKGTELDALVQLAQAAGVTYRVVPDIRQVEDLAADGNLLFIFNHFLTDPVALPSLAEQVNYDPLLGDRLQECRTASGRLPNFVTVDFYDIGDLFPAVDALNAP